MTRRLMLGTLAAIGATALAMLAPEPAAAGCVMQRQCRPAYRYERRTSYQRQCNTMWFAGRRQTSCWNQPITRTVPVAYQDCSRVARVCSDLGSLIGSRKRRR